MSRFIIVLLSLLFFTLPALAGDNPTTPENPGQAIDTLAKNIPKSGGNLESSGVLIDPKLYQGVTDQSDLILSSLRKLLGEPVIAIQNQISQTQYSTDTEQLTIVTKVIKLSAMIAITFSGMLLTFIIFGSMLNGARHGSFLGKWDSWMVPMRIAVSNVMLIPIPKFGGFNSAHVLIIMLFLLGLGGANYMASFFMEQAFNGKLVEPKMQTDNINIVKTVLKAKLCALDYEKTTGKTLDFIAKTAIQDNEKSGNFISALWNQAKKSFNVNPTNTYKFKLSYGSHKECGFKEYDTTEAKPGTANYDTATAVKTQTFTHTFPQAFNDLNTALDPVAKGLFKFFYKEKDLTDTDVKHYQAQMGTALETFNNKISGNISGKMKVIQQEGYQKALDTFKKGGFALLGSYYWVIMNRQQVIDTAYNDSTSLDKFHLSAADISGFKNIENDAIQFNKLVNSLKLPRSPLTMPTPSDVDPKGGIDSFFDSFKESIVNGILWALVRNSGDEIEPMLTIRSMGNTILAINVAMFGVVEGFGTASESGRFLTLGTSGGIAYALRNVLIAWPGTIATMLVGVGAIMAIVIPYMPFMMMLMAIVGLLTYFLEALTGVSWWMAYHSHPDGNEFYGKAGNGYNIVLNLTLRAIFITMGFIFAYALFRVTSWLALSMVKGVIMWMTDGGISLGAAWVIGTITMLAATLLALAYKSFQLTYELPNFILRWLGSSDHSDTGESEGKNQVIAMGAGAGNKMPQALAAIQKNRADDGSGDDGGGGGGGGGGDGDASKMPKGLAPLKENKDSGSNSQLSSMKSYASEFNNRTKDR